MTITAPSRESKRPKDALANLRKTFDLRRMKRNSHPRRRHARHHVSAADRAAFREDGYFGPVGRKTSCPRDHFIFPRARRGSRSGHLTQQALHRAGYTFASLGREANWQEVHAWLSENCRWRLGRRYTWYGNVFWFEAPEHRQAFMQRFPCSEDYRQDFFHH